MPSLAFISGPTEGEKIPLPQAEIRKSSASLLSEFLRRSDSARGVPLRPAEGPLARGSLGHAFLTGCNANRVVLPPLVGTLGSLAPLDRRPVFARAGVLLSPSRLSQANHVPRQRWQSGLHEIAVARVTREWCRRYRIRTLPRIDRLGIVVGEHDVFNELEALCPGHSAFQGNALALVPGNSKQGERPLGAIPCDYRVDPGDTSMLLVLVLRTRSDLMHHRPATEERRVKEGIENRLPPGRPAVLGQDRCNGVHELSQAGDPDSLGVPQQSDEAATDD